MNKSISLESSPLQVEYCFNKVRDNRAGGISLFVGTIRNHNKGHKVTHLEFDAYEPMAIREMTNIADKAIEKFDLFGIAIHHRTGYMNIGDIAVIIAVSSVHREAAHAASLWAINRLKETVPIWKKEFREDGTCWINARP